MPTTPAAPLTDQLANINPLIIVLIVLAFTLVRIALARVPQVWARTVSETCDTVNFVLILAFLLVRPFVAQAFYIPSESMENTLITRDRLIVDKFSYRLQEPRRGDVVVFNAPPNATDEGVDGIDFIKRLVALPGETVQVKAARLSLDGEPLDNGQPGVHEYLRGRLNLGIEDSIKLFPDHILINNKEKMTKERLAERLGQPGASVEIVPGQTLVNGKVLNEPYTREDPDYNYPVVGDEPLRLEVGQLFMMGDNRNRSRDSHAWGPLKRNRVVGHARVVFWPPTRAGFIR